MTDEDKQVINLREDRVKAAKWEAILARPEDLQPNQSCAFRRYRVLLLTLSLKTGLTFTRLTNAHLGPAMFQILSGK